MSYTRNSLSVELFTGRTTFVGAPDPSHNVNSFVNLRTFRKGEKVVNHKLAIASGKGATTAYQTDASRVERRTPGKYALGVIRKDNNQRLAETFNGFGQSVSAPTHLAVSSVDAENEALMKIIKKLRSERSHLNGLAFTGELREAIHGLRHPFQLMRDQVYSHLNTLGKRKRALGKYPESVRKKAWREIVAGTWLETSFGLKPLIHDAKEIAEGVARAQFDPVLRTRLHSGASSLVSDTQSTTGSVSNIIPVRFQQLDRVTKTRAFCSYSVGMFCEVAADQGACRRLIDTLGFTPENFVPALYEVMPWSWLIDYFSNLGQLIEAATTSTTGVQWVSKSVGKKTEVYYISRIAKPFILPGDLFALDYFNSNGHLGEIKLSRATYERFKDPILGIPTLRLSLPTRGTQWANLTAVLAQFSGKTFDPSWARLVNSTPNADAARNRRKGVYGAEAFLN